MSDYAVVVWAVIDRDGEVVGAYTNRISAARRCDYLDADKERVGTFGPYGMVRCEGRILARGGKKA
jgi:hypothetical protein